MRGLGLLDTRTVFLKDKTRTRLRGSILEDSNISGLDRRELEGYEIHMGTTENLGQAVPMIELEDGRVDAYRTKNGRIWGSYLHGIFDNEDLLFALVADLMEEKGINPDENHLSVAEYKEIQYDKLADLTRRSLDMDAIYKILFGEGGSPKEEKTDQEGQASQEGEAQGESRVGCGGLLDDQSGIGLVHLYCGDGKGKTTCGVVLTVRAAGSGRKVLFHQFLKDNSSSERKVLERIPEVTILPGREYEKFTFQMTAEELEEVLENNDSVFRTLCEQAAEYDVLVMDEALYAIDKGLLSEEPVLAFLEERPAGLEVVLTGRKKKKKTH